MGFIVDLVLILIVAVSIFVAYRKGFLISLIGVLGVVISIILSISVAPPLAEALYSAAFEKKIEATVEASIDNRLSETEIATQGAIDSVYSKLPAFISKYANDNGYSSEQVAEKLINGELHSNELSSSICDKAIDPAIISILKYFLIIILFFPFLVLTRLLSRFISAIIRGNILGKLNSILGGIIGLLRGAAFAILFCLLVSLIANLFSVSWLSEAIESSFLTAFILKLFPFSF